MEKRPVTIDTTISQTIYQLEKKCRRILRSSKEASHRKDEARKLNAELATLSKFVDNVRELDEYGTAYNMMDEDSDTYEISLVSRADLKKMLKEKTPKVFKYQKETKTTITGLSCMDENGCFPLDHTSINFNPYINIVETVEDRDVPNSTRITRHTTFYVAVRKRLF